MLKFLVLKCWFLFNYLVIRLLWFWSDFIFSTLVLVEKYSENLYLQ